MNPWPAVQRSAVIVLLSCASCSCASELEVGDTDHPARLVRRRLEVRGVTLAPIEDTRLGEVGYGSARCGEALDEAVDLRANWVSLTPFGRMDDLEDTDIIPDFEIPLSRATQMLARAIHQARQRGLRVALFPHVYVMSGQWRGEIDPGDEAAWEAWFSSYERFLLGWAAFAEEQRVDLLSIGVEFKSSTNARPDRWRRTIAAVRRLYGGPLTYCANWDEVEDVELWNELDFIGVNAFSPLAEKPGDGFEQMSAKARLWAARLEALAVLWDRPVIFTEFGIKSASDSALAPWEWPEHCSALRYDEPYQAMAYDAVLGAFIDEPWFAGLFLWKLLSDPWDETQENKAGFSPRGKLGAAALTWWFALPWGTFDSSPALGPLVHPL
ncbi:MAG: hypothetical protein MUC50_14305 [Myxococcota bacterium]|jgi:hypothetical protein|nr:hypothetical protein [Myxococcota bacterium]